MFGLEIDEISIEPVEIDGDVYVPIHIEQGQMTTFMYRKYDDLEFEDGDRLGTDDYRYDP